MRQVRLNLLESSATEQSHSSGEVAVKRDLRERVLKDLTERISNVGNVLL